jgi:hypothetical protein
MHTVKRDCYSGALLGGFIALLLAMLQPAVALGCAPIQGACSNAIDCCESDTTCDSNVCRFNTGAGPCSQPGDCITGNCNKGTGRCETKALCGSTGCLSNLDCGDPGVGATECINGTCYFPPGVNCGPGNQNAGCCASGVCNESTRYLCAASNPGQPTELCQTTNDCATGSECVQGHCYWPSGTKLTCGQSSMGTCVSDSCNGTTSCGCSNNGGPCATTNDCCTPTTDECVGNVCATKINQPCATTTTCVGDVPGQPPGTSCFLDICYPPGSNCVPKKYCMALDEENACNSNADCSQTRVCVTNQNFGPRAGTCLVATGNKCVHNSECVTNNCVGGVCTCNGKRPDSGVFGPCLSSTDCCNPNGATPSTVGSYDYECWPNTNMCYIAPASSTNQNAYCQYDSECITGYCDAGACNCGLSTNSGCAVTADCCSPHVCTDGQQGVIGNNGFCSFNP